MYDFAIGVWRICDERALPLSSLAWLVPLRVTVDRMNVINLRDRSSQRSIVIPSRLRKNLGCKEGGAATAAEMRVYSFIYVPYSLHVHRAILP